MKRIVWLIVLVCFIPSISWSIGAPNDSLYPHQWNLKKTKWLEAMEIVKQKVAENIYKPIVVAIIDKGFNQDQCDLQGVWSDKSKSFVLSDGRINPGPPDNEHGTSMAGIIAANTNNNEGISGIAGGWSSIPGESGSIPGVKIMAIRFNPAHTTDRTMGDAIRYAADKGAKVICMSFAMPNTTNNNYIDAAIKYAYEQQDVFLCAGSGKTGSNTVEYPANNKYVVAVGGTDRNDFRDSWYSNYGEKLDIVAPGTDIYSSEDGTCPAAAHVAGLAALIRSIDPDLTARKVWEYIKAGAKDLVPSGKDEQHGWGRINIYSTVATTPTKYGELNDQLRGRVLWDTVCYDSEPKKDAPCGVFSFTAEFCNIGDNIRVYELKSVTNKLTNNNVLLNRDFPLLTPPGVGSKLTFPETPPPSDYDDLILERGAEGVGECTVVDYKIGLTSKKSFTFLVDVHGVMEYEE